MVVNVLLLDFGDTTFADMGVVAFIIFLFLFIFSLPLCGIYTRNKPHTHTMGKWHIGGWAYGDIYLPVNLYIYIYIYIGNRWLGHWEYGYWDIGIGYLVLVLGIGGPWAYMDGHR